MKVKDGWTAFVLWVVLFWGDPDMYDLIMAALANVVLY